MKKIKVLNLYAGIGGNRKGWESFEDMIEVTAVEINSEIAEVYKKFFPQDKVIIGDAHEFLLKYFREFDFIWSSPPCQSHSKMNKATRHSSKKFPDMQLYEEIIFLQNFFKGKWVVENVRPYYEPLIEPYYIGRHCFWSNFEIMTNLLLKNVSDFILQCNVNSSTKLKNWLGLVYKGNLYTRNNHDPCQVLRNCVHPRLAHHVFDCAYGKLSKPLERWLK